MRRLTVLLSATLLALALTAGSALAMQPPGGPAQHLFGCPDPIAGHPGAAGIVDATSRVAELTGSTHPTAWNAVEYAEPIELGECH